MKKIKELSGYLVINPMEDTVFENCLFHNVKINANYGNIKFLNCTFLNDFKIENANNVSFSMSTFLFEGENKMASSFVMGKNIDMEYIYINDLKGFSVCKFVCDSIEVKKLVYDTVTNKDSYFDVIANSYKIENSDINARKSFMMKDDMNNEFSKIKRVVRKKI